VTLRLGQRQRVVVEGGALSSVVPRREEADLRGGVRQMFNHTQCIQAETVHVSPPLYMISLVQRVNQCSAMTCPFLMLEQNVLVTSSFLDVFEVCGG